MTARDAAAGSGIRLLAAVSVTAVALCGVGALVTLLGSGPDRPTTAAAAVVLGSVVGLGLYAARKARRTETPYWRS